MDVNSNFSPPKMNVNMNGPAVNMHVSGPSANVNLGGTSMNMHVNGPSVNTNGPSMHGHNNMGLSIKVASPL